MAQWFTTFALNYDPRDRLTTAFLGFTHIDGFPLKLVPGALFLEMLEENAAGISQPMLMPLIMADAWVTQFEYTINQTATKLAEFQTETQLLNEYLRSSNLIKKGLSFDQLHKNLIQQHAYLTNGIFEAVGAFGPAICSALDQLEEWLGTGHNDGEGPEGRYNTFYMRQCTQRMARQIDEGIVRRNRALDRINAYFQVVRLDEYGH